MKRAGVELDWQGDLSHAEAIKAMHACDALLVVHNNSASAKASTPGKMFECLATGRPMLVVGPAQGDLEAPGPPEEQQRAEPQERGGSQRPLLRTPDPTRRISPETPIPHG